MQLEHARSFIRRHMKVISWIKSSCRLFPKQQDRFCDQRPIPTSSAVRKPFFPNHPIIWLPKDVHKFFTRCDHQKIRIESGHPHKICTELSVVGLRFLIVHIASVIIIDVIRWISERHHRALTVEEMPNSVFCCTVSTEDAMG